MIYPRPISLCTSNVETAVYRTVYTVVWEDGGWSLSARLRCYSMVTQERIKNKLVWHRSMYQINLFTGYIYLIEDSSLHRKSWRLTLTNSRGQKVKLEKHRQHCQKSIFFGKGLYHIQGNQELSESTGSILGPVKMEHEPIGRVSGMISFFQSDHS